MQNIKSGVTQQLCRIYKETGIVCPPVLQNDIFTSAAIDNLDHNPTSASATDSFHGTCISIFQHLNEEIQFAKLQLEKANKSTKATYVLPEYYTEVFPAKTGVADYPLQSVNAECPSLPLQDISRATDWLGKVNANYAKEESNSFSENEMVSWSAFYSSRVSKSNTPAKSLTALLPLLKESITSTATVAHTFKIIQSILLKVNPSQIPVITADQPVYAIAKQVQWRYLNSYGEDKVFIMMGALHIEMCFLSAIGDWKSW